MKIAYHKHNTRRKKSIDLWLRIATDYNGGMTAKDIAKRYTNPITKKPYTREHVYWVLKQLATAPVAKMKPEKQKPKKH